MAEPAGRPSPQQIVVGEVQRLSPLIRRVTAPNPGVMTGPGTNAYLVGDRSVAVIDPGPDDPGHIDVLAEAGDGRIRWILLTHTHIDHAPGAAGLAERTGAEILAFDARDGVEPTATLADGARLDLDGAEIVALHTPGHASNHLCYELAGEQVIFSGDHVMQGSTVVISPPDGDMAAYLDSLRRVRHRHPEAIAPGHGTLIDDPDAVLAYYIDHRLAREAAIAAALAQRGSATVDLLVADVYTDVPEALHPVARYSVHAHLLKLSAEGRVRGGLGIDADWSVGS
jgi:glyoxylase-like metal-dependent hydrolase (beta-lactamase superfamily II)